MEKRGTSLMLAGVTEANWKCTDFEIFLANSIALVADSSNIEIGYYF